MLAAPVSQSQWLRLRILRVLRSDLLEPAVPTGASLLRLHLQLQMAEVEAEVETEIKTAIARQIETVTAERANMQRWFDLVRPSGANHLLHLRT